MKPGCVRLVLVCLAEMILFPGVARTMTVQFGSGGEDLVAPGEPWRFLRGRGPASDPADAWRTVGFDDSSWETGVAGFGYGDGDDATVLDDMQGNYATVYIRRGFSIASLDRGAGLELLIDYDDGFIAYLNGSEVARRRMPAGAATHRTLASSHEAGTPEIIPLGTAGNLLREGKNVLAIEGHNASLTSSDFSLIPVLRVASNVVRNGDTYIVSEELVELTARTQAGGVATVVLGETAAQFDPKERTWRAEVTLAPGLNTITARALNAGDTEVDSGAVEIVYVPEANHFAGELTGDTILSHAAVFESTVRVPAGRVLTIRPGTVVLMTRGVSLVVAGQLLAEGTQDEPIRFTHYGDGTTWKQLLFVEAADSRLECCIIEYADSEGAHQDYYEPGPRQYHEAVVALACRLDINDCMFRRLPNDGPRAEGDAIAIISDDPDHPGEASARITGCQFLSIGQGVHTRYAYVLVEGCFFTGKRGDNDDVDLWGESAPPPLVQYNTFLNPEHDDAINPTRCSAIIIGNFIAGTDDHGIVLRDKGSPIVINNVIFDCRNGGIAVENSNTATLINNTIVGCGRGLRLFDLGRWGPPYRLNPGGGTATVINCIIWDCPQPIVLADSANTQIADRGSHVTVTHSDIQGGRGGISISGQYSTLTWGRGNINADPLFVDPGQLDFHLRPGSPAIDAANTAEAPDTDHDGNRRPSGPAADMGAYEYGGTPTP